MGYSSIGRKFSYLCGYKDSFDNLKKEVEKLNEAKESLQRRVDVAKGNGQGIEEIVDKWVISVNKIVDEAGKFDEDEQKAKKKCFIWLCPNLKSRYQLSRKAVGKAEAVVALQEQGKFDKVSGVTIPTYRLHRQAEGFLAFTSRKSILDKILDALGDDSVNRIGVYGKGGIGKTTLVKEVAREVKEDKLFDKVVFAEVSRTPDVQRIQGQIADQLDLKFYAESESERAMMLCDRLKKEEKMLVIVDNIWTGLDLERVGIPLGDDHKGCKVLLTSRMWHVLSNDMGCQKNYLVSVLTKDEAWSLFQKMVGDCVDNPDLQPIAIDLASICAGWPIVIVTVASALRNKSVLEWKDALLKLSRSSLENITDVDPVVYSTIELSYNHLDDQEAKSTFLLCTLMKHPYDVPIMDLLKYAVGLGLFNDTNTMEETRDRVYTLVHKLKDSGLLCDGHTSECFSMHDVVRDVAISMASREQHVFTFQNKVVQRESTGKDTLKTCTSIPLCNSNIVELPEELECPQLKFFYMNAKDSFRKIPDNFFTGRTELRVLVLTEILLYFLPSSFDLLVNLQTLCLDQCILGDIANIGNLKKLHILSLRCSNIEHLPGEIGQLTQLRLLDLSNCPNLKVISRNVISSLSHLEELYMGNTSVEWEFEGLNTDGNNANLNEFQHLCHLTRLEIHIKDAKILPKGLFSRELKRYKIFIGDEWDWFGNYDNTRTLRLKLNTNVCLEDGAIMQLKGIEDLYLDEVQGVENILYKLDEAGFPQLKHLHVQNNPYILCIVDSMESVPCDAFPVLESLSLCNLMKLEKICSGQLTMGSFCKLRIIKVANCDKLKNIFSFSIMRGLPLLQTIKVNKCKNMEVIFANGREDDVNYNEVIDKIELGWLRSLTLKFLPQLTSFCSKVNLPSKLHKRQEHLTTFTGSNEVLRGELDTPISLFNEKVVFPNLEALELCAISFEKIWQNELASCFQNLTRLIVHGCDKLKYVFSSSIVKSFSQLQHIEICYCTVLEEIVSKEEGPEGTSQFVFPRVTFLKLCNLPQLRTFYPVLHTSDWPLLKRLEVYGCDKVRIFSKYFSFQRTKKVQLHMPAQHALFLVEKVMTNLEELKISGKDIKLICQPQFPQHLFHKIKSLEVINDKSAALPVGLLQRFHGLEKLELRWSSYKEIFSFGDMEKLSGMCTHMKSLKLWKLYNLKHMWQLDSIVQNLEVLEVWWCDNLINLVPNLTSFQNLTILEVWQCKRLVKLLTLSTAKSLVRLVKMRINGCQMMTEIIADEGDVVEDEIIFSNLKWLSLECLESLTSFSSCNYTLKFPSLEDLFVIECPKMEIFSYGVLSAPMVQEVRQNQELGKGCWEGGLNKTIQQLHMEKILLHAQQESVNLQQPQIDPSLQEWLKSSVTQAKKKVIQTKPSAKEKPFATRGQTVGEEMIDISMKLRGKVEDIQEMDASDSGRGLSLKKQQSRHTVRASVDQLALGDGYIWSKYGQKNIMGSKFPRSYFRCAHSVACKCHAKKKVQQLDDPTSFEITYDGMHTCPVSSTAPQGFPLSAKVTQEMTERNTNSQQVGPLEPILLEEEITEEEERSRNTVRASVDRLALGDGCTWSKYGQKNMVGSKFPRSYYMCAAYQCLAKKCVQQLDDHPALFEIIYLGTHSCRVSSKAPPVLPLPGERRTNLEPVGALAPLSAKITKEEQQSREFRHIMRVSSLFDDGHTWRKYGQKEILGSKFPRSYYRCTHQTLYNCFARRQVQQLNDDPSSFEITYFGVHTCRPVLSTVPSALPLSSEITQEMTRRKASLKTHVPIAPLVIPSSEEITKGMTRKKTSLRIHVPIAPLLIPSELSFTFSEWLSGSADLNTGKSIDRSMAGGDGGGAGLFPSRSGGETGDQSLMSDVVDELFYEIWLHQ